MKIGKNSGGLPLISITKHGININEAGRGIILGLNKWTFYACLWLSPKHQYRLGFRL